eukprot:CAMPEP_0203749012 /NCGR_PEP_ID=MMETSP0098-20131031/3720_1 /ASSEMBLY_ACC=CAM_ASM_000208 /TAXON_ID=96639 /ORGANISM=" , Strain NY0313808BC1" /LENGTH=327 /DNA_ID=CAMNT_0050637941 /DNA_START=4525 /DNA_END=5508 /DNA_ORIENTATION=-
MRMNTQQRTVETAEETTIEVSDRPLPQVGATVVRGEGWQWVNQDGGRGNRGIVVGIVDWKDLPARGVRVLWDNGNWNVYRWGAEGLYDIEVVENEPLIPEDSIGWKLPDKIDNRCKVKERTALRNLYNELGGDEWTFHDGWSNHENIQIPDESTDVCNVQNDADEAMFYEDKNDPCLTPWTGVVCKEGHVISLRLDRNNVKGRLSMSTLKALPKLMSLDLSFNKLTQSLPIDICEGGLQELKTLELKHNELTSTIPKSLGKCKMLEWLSFSNNQLEGTLPKEIGLLQNLQFAFFGHNKLDIRKSGVPKEIKRLPKLQRKHPKVEFNL